MSITLGRDFGADVEVVSGLTGQESRHRQPSGFDHRRRASENRAAKASKEVRAVDRPQLANLRRALHRRCSSVLIPIAATAVLLVSGCTVGPNYVRPTAEVPTNFKETPANWKQAQPSDAIAKGKWWEIYQDPQLDALEEQIDVSNQSLKAAQEQFAQARAALRITRSNLFPAVSADPSISRTHLSRNEPLFNAIDGASELQHLRYSR